MAARLTVFTDAERAVAVRAVVARFAVDCWTDELRAFVVVRATVVWASLRAVVDVNRGFTLVDDVLLVRPLRATTFVPLDAVVVDVRSTEFVPRTAAAAPAMPTKHAMVKNKNFFIYSYYS